MSRLAISRADLRSATRAPGRAFAVLLATATLFTANHAVAQTLVDAGSPMRYVANVTDPGIVGLEWTALSYGEPGWSSGLYGIGYETGSSAHDMLTTYVPTDTQSIFTRATFTVDDPGQVLTLTLGVDYDDGAVAWINGVEVYRSPSMPAGAPTWSTTSSLHESSNGIDATFTLTDISSLAIPQLIAGENVLAIGVWNGTLPSSDLVLIPRVYANTPPAFVTRGPYLQLGTEESLVVRWTTDVATTSEVRYGVAPGPLTDVVNDPAVTLDHEISLTGLSADTDYSYSVGTIGEALVGGDPEYTFRTAPLPGTRDPFDVWVIGDSGTANDNAAAVRDGYVAHSQGEIPGLWLMLGDNAYNDGTQDEYEGAVFNAYPRMLRRSVVWPTLGNHDAGSASSNSPGNESGVYYDIFTLPANAEAGGSVSGTEAYYSFDYGNVHFVVLNSQDVDRTPTGLMLGWLETDLMNTLQDWVIAYWHHPPYSDGTHFSDTSTQLVQMRQWALPVLESHGVDLVLGGHSHSYERSFLLDSHYGVSTSLTASMKVDDGDGRFGGDGPYQKASQGLEQHEGAVYVVAGSSGKLDFSPLEHPVMVESLAEFGSVALEIRGDRLDATFVDPDGVVRDRFTIVKNTAVAPTAEFSAAPLVGPAPLSVTFDDLSTTNAAAWAWDFDGNGSTDSDVQAPPNQLYSVPGEYEVRLTVSNASGSDQEIKVGYVCASTTPTVVTDLVMPDPTTLSWGGAAGMTSYDVIRGDLALLVAGVGDFPGSLTDCLADGVQATQVTDTDPPAAGGTYYLVRAVSCDVPGTYDGGSPAQAAGRDAGLPNVPPACP